MLSVSSKLAKVKKTLTVAAEPQPQPLATWGPSAAILVTILSFVLSNAGASVILAMVPGFLGWSARHAEVWLRESVAAQFFYILTVEVLALGMLWWFVRHRKGSLGMIGFGRKPRWADLGQATLGFFVYFGAFIVIAALAQYLLPIDVGQKQDIGFDSYGHTAPALVLIFVSLAILPPIAEEILFRGFLFSGLRRVWNVGVTVLTSSVIFSSLHLLGGFSGEGLLWIAGIDTFVLALVLSYLRVATGSIWASILVHFAKNTVAFVLLFILHVN